MDKGCIPLSSTRNSLSYFIQLQLTPITDDLPPMEHLYEMFADRKWLSVADTWFKTNGVPLEFFSLFAQPVTINNKVLAKELIVKIGKLKSPVIIDKVLKRIKSALDQEWEMILYEQAYRFSVNFYKYREFVVDGTYARYDEVEWVEKQTMTFNPSRNYTYKPIGVYLPVHKEILPSVILSKMNFCEQVHLERSEWIGLWQEIRLNLTGAGNKKVLGDSEYSMYANDQGKATVNICVEDFNPSYYSVIANNAPAYNSVDRRLLCVCSLFFPTLLYTKI